MWMEFSRVPVLPGTIDLSMMIEHDVNAAARLGVKYRRD